MDTESLTSPEKHPSVFDLRSKIDTTLSAPLTDPHELRGYALSALYGVVEIIEEAKAFYDKQPTILGEDSRGEEENAVRYLSGNQQYIDMVLERLLAIDERIKALYRDEAQHTFDKPIVPPQQMQQNVVSGEGVYEKPEVLDRSVTIKFILERQLGQLFEVLKEQGRVQTFDGVNDPNMMRRLSYQLIVSSDYNRSILVCDEEGNRTFMFDTAQLNERKVSPEELIRYTKPELDALIESQAGIGKAIIYSPKTFVNSIVSSLESLETNEKASDQNLLVPYATPDIRSGNQIKNFLNEKYDSNIDHKTIYKIAAELREQDTIVGESYRFGKRRVIPGYTAQEVDAIESALLERELLHPTALEGESPFPAGVAAVLGVGRTAVLRAAESLGDRLGEMPLRRFVSATSPACNPEQLELLRDRLFNPSRTAQETSNTEPEAEQLRMTHRLTNDELVATIGTGAKYKALLTIMEELDFARHAITINDESVLSAIRQRALDMGYSRPPEGYASKVMVMHEHGLSRTRFDYAVAALGETLGGVTSHIYGPRPYLSYSPAQQQLILEKDRRLVAMRAPKRRGDRYTDIEIADMLGVSRAMVDQKLLPGQPFTLEFNGTKNVRTYGQEVVDSLRERPDVQVISSVVTAPEGVESVATFARPWHVAPRRVTQIAHEHHMPIGNYRFGARVGEGYTERDRRYLREVLDEGSK